eukprot:TRINITY_DN13888_c0_g1_i3.p1 TRINITY_DN13888_c0_g1~~TRINITY_DN13888_c0_g1_i3.p1  ORF type:complete len:1011 (+),score=158.72 TRINITY_DN13888_c0_g1_i3:101-3133(+)
MAYTDSLRSVIDNTLRLTRVETGDLEDSTSALLSASRARQQNDALLGWQIFETRLARLKEAGRDLTRPLDFDLEESLPNATEGLFKDKRVTGRLLHYALYHGLVVDCPKAADLATVVAAGAQLNAYFTVQSYTHVVEAEAVHLTCSIGYLPGLCLLLEWGADKNAFCREDSLPYCAPIHEAAYMRHTHVVSKLLEAGASMDQPNGKGMTPLHLAAWSGSVDVCKKLVACNDFRPDMLSGRAAFQIDNEPCNYTPFEIATFQSMFEPSELRLLMPFCYGAGSFFFAIRRMCKTHQRSAKKVIDSIEQSPEREKLHAWIRQEAMRRSGTYHNGSYSERTVDDNDIDEEFESDESIIGCMAEIIANAPQVAMKILDVLSRPPFVNHSTSMHHPLPCMADVRSDDIIARATGHHDPMRVYYVGDYVEDEIEICPYHTTRAGDRPLGIPAWRQNPETTKIPAWHSKLAPSVRNCLRKDIREVDVTVLLLPGFLDVRIATALASCPELDIFAKRPVQGLCYAAWAVVQWGFYLDLFFEFLVTVVITYYAVVLQEGDVRIHEHNLINHAENNLVVRFCNSVLMGTLLREITKLVCYLFNYVVRRGFKARGLLERKHFGVPAIVYELASLVLLSCFVAFLFWEDTDSLEDVLYPIVGGLDRRRLKDSTDDVDDSEKLKKRWHGRTSHLFLAANVFCRWINFTSMLCYVGGIGEKILAILKSVDPIMNILTIMFLLYLALVCTLLSLRGHTPWASVVHDTFLAVFLADTGMYERLEELDAQLFSSCVSKFLMYLSSIMFTLIILNLVIGVYSNVYSEIEQNSYLLFLRSRAEISTRYLMEPVWPSRSHTSACLWRYLPTLLVLTLGTLWLVMLVYLRDHPGAGVPLFLCSVILQSTFVKRARFDSAPQHSSAGRMSEGLASEVHAMPSTTPTHSRYQDCCLWMCTRIDFDEQFYSHDLNEVREAVIELGGCVPRLEESLQRISQRLEELRQALNWATDNDGGVLLRISRQQLRSQCKGS